jgi:hypothetical protein
MMGSFVDRAFGDDPTQLAVKAGDSRKLGRDRPGSNGVISAENPTTRQGQAIAARERGQSD